MTVLDLQVSSDSDNARWTEGNSTFNDGIFSFGYQSGTAGPANALMRLAGVSVPNASDIDAAYATLTSSSSSVTDLNQAVWSAIDADNAAAPTTYSGAENASRTSASVGWSDIPAWVADTEYNSPSLVSIVSEIVNRPGWSAGNAIVLYCEDNGSPTSMFRIRSAITFGVDPDRAPLLHIEYVSNTAPTITVAPTVSYASGSALTSANSPADVDFTVTDAEETGANAISWAIWTGSGGTGTQVTSGTATSGIGETAEIAWNDPGIAEGAQTLYLLVSDGTDTDEESFSLTVDLSQTASMMHIASTATVHTPGITPGAVTVGMNTIGAGSTLYQPGVTPGSVSIGMNAIASTSETYQPGVEPGSVTVGMNHIASTLEVHEPDILLGISNIGMEHIAATSTTHTPGVQYDQSAGMNHIAATSEAHEPGVQYDQPVGMEHIASTAALYQPSVSPGAVVIGMNHIGSTATLYAPGLLYDQIVGMNAIGSTFVLYQPAVLPTQAVGMNHIESGATLYLMTITAGPKTSTILVASPRRDPHFYVTLYPHPGRPNESQRLDWIDLNPDLTGISWTTTTPGGFAQFRAGHNNHERPLANPLIPRELHWQDFARIEVTDGALVLFEGRTEDRDESPKASRTLTAMGWGYSAIYDMPFFSDSDTLATTGDVLRTVLAYAAPFIRPASGDLYVDPLVEHAPSEFDAWYPSQVLDQITKEGDDDGNLMDWWVWENRALWLRPRVAPATADYYLPFDRRYISDWRRHVKDRRGVVWVDHTEDGVATRTGPITAPGFTSDIGFQRGRVLAVGEMSVSTATRLGQTFLTYHSGERYTGVVEIGPDDVLIGAGGRPVPAYMARAGQWLQVGDYAPLMIVQQEYNANARRQRLTLGDRLDSYETRVAQTIRDAELRKLGSNPLGGRL